MLPDHEKRGFQNRGFQSKIEKVPKAEVRVRKSDKAKCGTKVSSSTTLAQFSDRIPPKNNEKPPEQNIANHKEFPLRQNLGSKKIKRSRKQADDVIFFLLPALVFQFPGRFTKHWKRGLQSKTLNLMKRLRWGNTLLKCFNSIYHLEGHLLNPQPHRHLNRHQPLY